MKNLNKWKPGASSRSEENGLKTAVSFKFCTLDDVISVLVFIGLLFVILVLFGGFFNTSNTGTSTIMLANLSG